MESMATPMIAFAPSIKECLHIWEIWPGDVLRLCQITIIDFLVPKFGTNENGMKPKTIRKWKYCQCEHFLLNVSKNKIWIGIPGIILVKRSPTFKHPMQN